MFSKCNIFVRIVSPQRVFSVMFEDKCPKCVKKATESSLSEGDRRKIITPNTFVLSTNSLQVFDNISVLQNISELFFFFLATDIY